MEDLSKSVIPVIESYYETLTTSEKTIADFFIGNANEDENFSAASISRKLHISEATLTRFSKKCGYSGYREFIYAYKSNIVIESDENIHRQLTKKILGDYEEILNKTYSLINEEQMERIIKKIIESKRVYFYGLGSSGLVAQEMKSRFMRLGLVCDTFIDADMIKMNSAILDEECLVIALSISSDSSAMLYALEQANKNEATTILFTANQKGNFKDICQEIVSIATTKNLHFGNRISPQFPLLVVIDILYGYFSNSDYDSKKEIFSSTLLALDDQYY